MLAAAGVYSARQSALTQQGFEAAMAAFEKILWQRVKAGIVPDPRLCTICSRPLKRTSNNTGACPEACQRRKVYAWSPDYWRNRRIKAGAANSRQLWKLRQVWTLLQDYLDPDERNDRYLAGIIAHTCNTHAQRFLENNTVNWARVTSRQAHLTIEALKDRLNYTLK